MNSTLYAVFNGAFAFSALTWASNFCHCVRLAVSPSVDGYVRLMSPKLVAVWRASAWVSWPTFVCTYVVEGRGVRGRVILQKVVCHGGVVEVAGSVDSVEAVLRLHTGQASYRPQERDQ